MYACASTFNEGQPIGHTAVLEFVVVFEWRENACEMGDDTFSGRIRCTGTDRGVSSAVNSKLMFQVLTHLA